MAEPEAITAPASRSTDDTEVSGGGWRPEPDRYLLLDRLGAGGMGVVWAAYDRRLDRKVALKLLHDRYLGADDQERLAREARAMARLAHPNVVPVFDVGERDGRTFLTMELVRGRSLREWLGERRGWREIAAVFGDVARGLAAAHAAGLVHRDVKPGNILFGDDGRARIADFGVSRADRGDDTAPAATSSVETVGPIGSPAYMAPEQLRGERADAASDQFGLCVALHEALTGARPFAADTVDAQLDAIADGPPAIAGDVPDWLVRLVARGLASDPAARFASMDALARALDGPPPSRLRRVAPFAAIAVALAIAVIAIAMVATQRRATGRAAEPPPPACGDEAQAAIAATWDGARRDALIAGFTQAGAAAEGRRIAGAIDKHAVAWRTERETTCRASRIDHTWPRDLGDMAATCLDEQRVQLGALIDALGKADTAAIADGHDLVVKLDPPAPCGDADYLRGRVRPPRDPARAAEIADLERRKAALLTALNLGRIDEVERDAPAFRADADKSGDVALRCEALHVAGRLARVHQDLPGAIALAKQAYLLARRARDVAEAAIAASDLVWLYGYFKGDFDPAEDWANLALVEIDSMPYSKEAVLVHQAIGIYAEHRGQGERAVTEAQLTLATVRRYYGDQHYMTAYSMATVASALAEANRYDESAAVYREATPLIEQAFGAESLSYAHMLSHEAVVFSTVGACDEAPKVAARSLEVGRAAHAAGSDLASLHLNQGATLQQCDHTAESLAALVAAHDGYLAAGEPELAAQALGNLGDVHAELARDRGDRALERQAIAELEEASRILADAWGADHPDTVLTLTQLAAVLVEAHDCTRATAVARRAIALFEHTPDDPAISDGLLVLGRCAIDAGRAAQAIEPLERAATIRHRHGNDPMLAAEGDAWLAIALHHGGDRTRARDLATTARAALATGPHRFAAVIARLDREMSAAAP